MPLSPDAHLPDETGRIIADPERFCVGHTLAAGEPLAGWGAHPERNILIRWPKQRWQHSLRIADGMPDDLARAIETAVEGGWRINLIDRKEDGGDRILLFPMALRFDVPVAEYAALIRAIVAQDDLAVFQPRPTAASCIFVCTHGKHDACCAKWGFGTYRAIRDQAGGAAEVDVWEVTHLGGCRFAGGALVLPARRKYGRLVPDDAARLLAAERSGEPYLPAYRGANGLNASEQVTEITALEVAGAQTRITSITLLQDGETERDYRVETPTHRYLIRCTASQLTSYGACSDLAAQKTLNPKTIWRGRVIASDNITKDME